MCAEHGRRWNWNITTPDSIIGGKHGGDMTDTNQNCENQEMQNSELDAKNYSFFAMLDRMQYIHRWGLMRNNQQENIKEHTMDVVVISHALALIRNHFFLDGSTPVDETKTVLTALFHDATEIITGDLPTPIKYRNNEIKRVYKEIEEQAAESLLSLLPENMREWYRPLLTPNLKEDKQAVILVKAADKICAYIKCIVEESVGNKEFLNAKSTILADIKEMDLPEVQYFMTHFAPAYGQTLDQNSK